MSAGQEAERSRRAAAEHRRRAEAAEQRAQAFEAGERGELIAAAALRAALPAGCHLWDDVRWPGRPIANIDGVVLGAFGLIVWDAKHWSGRVTVSNGSLRQNGYRRDDKLEAVRQAAAAVLQAGGLPPIGLPVLCLTGAATVPQPILVAGVTVLAAEQLPGWLARQPCIVSPAAVTGMAQPLDHVLVSAGRGPLIHGQPSTRPAVPRPQPRARRQPAGHARQPVARRRGQSRASAVRVVVAGVLAVSAMTGLLGRVLTPAASWIGHQAVKPIIKQVTNQPRPHSTP